MTTLIAALTLFLLNQAPLLNESFTNATFPPTGWDTLRSDTTMGDWYRYNYTGPSGPDTWQARVRVYAASDTLRIGWSTLKTYSLNLFSAAGQESLFFWYRFSQDVNNLGPDDTMYIDISNDDLSWINLMKIAQGTDTNIWQTARIDLQPYDAFNNARIRFHYEDMPNGNINPTNCNFWLDSVQVINYDTIPETVVLNELLVDPELFDHNNNSNFNDDDEEFIEIFNKAGSIIDVGNYSVQDIVGNNTLNIPAGFTIPDAGYLVLYASGELYIFDVNADTQSTGTWQGNWPDLDNTGDTISLSDDASNEVDSKGYTNNDVLPDFSIARLPNGSYNWVNNAFPTPGRDNGAVTVWPIAYAFRDLDSNYVPDLLDSTVTITGVITAPPGIYSDIEAYVQDYSGGICLFGDFNVPLNYGDSIMATGTVDQYRGKNELGNFDYTVIGSGTVPEPIDVDGSILNTEYYEGSLVRVKVSYISGFVLEGNQDYVAFDTLNNQFTIWIDSYTNIPGSLAPTDTFTLTGIKGQYTYASPPNDGYQLMPRDTSDFSHLFTAEITDIGEVQEVGPDGVSSKYADSVVTVEGVLTGPNYIFTAGSPSFYIQDSTGGINIYSAEGDSLFDRYIDSLGARFRITGTVTEYNGLTEVASGYAWFVGMDTVPQPRQILPNWFLTEGMESFLVEMTGIIASTPYQTGDGFNFDLLNGDAGIAVRFPTATGINPQSIMLHDKKTFTGIVGQYDPDEPYTTGYQLLLRLPADIREPGYDTVSAEPLIELVGTKTFIPSIGEQARININSPFDYRLELNIHDMSGRLVRRLYSGAGGPNTLYWDGRDDFARPCKLGIYLLNLKAINAAGKSSHERSLIVIGAQ
jgi:hypothetical protein